MADETTLRSGLTIACFLDGLAWKQLDNSMHKLLLRTLQDHYPARVHQVLVVSPGWCVALLRFFVPAPLPFSSPCLSPLLASPLSSL